MNNDLRDNMSDNEIRILGGNQADFSQVKGAASGKRDGKFPLWILALAVLALVAIIVALLVSKSHKQHNPHLGTADTIGNTSESVVTVEPAASAFLLTRDTVINDIPLHIIVPRNCRAGLRLGKLDGTGDLLLALPAADVRSDIDAPTGAFVVDGELIAKGRAKYGFCAIIGDEITIGRQLETTLFERSIEENGNFFRQYSLVSNGQLMEIPPKGKALRRALCFMDGEIQVVLSGDRESFHDFAQALTDLGVKEALSLPGGDAFLLQEDENGQKIAQGDVLRDHPHSENYIFWSRVGR